MKRIGKFSYGVYTGVLGTALLVFLLNDSYWYGQTGVFNFEWKHYLVLLSGLAVFPLMFKLGLYLKGKNHEQR